MQDYWSYLGHEFTRCSALTSAVFCLQPSLAPTEAFIFPNSTFPWRFKVFPAQLSLITSSCVTQESVCLVAPSCPTPWTVTPWTVWPTRLLCPWDLPDKNTGLGYRFLLQGIFPTQGLIPSLLCPLHWQMGSLPTAPSGKLLRNIPPLDFWQRLLALRSRMSTSSLPYNSAFRVILQVQTNYHDKTPDFVHAVCQQTYLENILGVKQFVKQYLESRAYSSRGRAAGGWGERLWLQQLLHLCCCSVPHSRLTPRPRGPWPTRLLRLWDSPGKNTGVDATSFSRGTSPPGDQTRVSCTCRILYHWVARTPRLK